MRQFDLPVSQFRYDLQKAGDKPLAFSFDGHYYPLASIYGETDLLSCQNTCKLQSGFYSLVSPRYHGQNFLEVIYQCGYCDHMRIRVFDIEESNKYLQDEKIFLGRLVNEVMVKRSQEIPSEYEKRKKSDIWKRNDPTKEKLKNQPKLRAILQEGPNDDVAIPYEAERYEIASLFGDTNLLPCPNSCYPKRGIYAVITPKTEEQPTIQIIYQCDHCDELSVKSYDINDLYQYSEDEYNFIVLMVQDIFIPRGKFGATELSIRRKIDIIVPTSTRNQQPVRRKKKKNKNSGK